MNRALAKKDEANPDIVKLPALDAFGERRPTTSRDLDMNKKRARETRALLQIASAAC